MTPELKTAIDNVVASLLGGDTDSLMKEAFSLATTPAEKREAGQYLRQAIANRKRPDVDVKGILGETAEVLNLSYIARRYFNKDRTWLYQRLNRSMVNGKPATFTEAELHRLSDSLKEVSNIILQSSTQLTH